MAEDRRADWPRDKTYSVHTKGLQRADKRIGSRKVEVGKYQAGDGAVEKEVVPFDRGPNRASQDRAAELAPMLCLIDSANFAAGGHLVSLRQHR